MKNAGLVLFVVLILGIFGGLAWVGSTIPDPKSCVAVAIESIKSPDNADIKARTRRACERVTASR